MTTTGRLSSESVCYVKLLLNDKKISSKVFENIGEHTMYKICTIAENGDVTLGKTRFEFWNNLIKCQKVIPFESLALKIWDALVDASSGLNNDAILNGLSLEIVKKAVRDKDYDYIVNRLFDCWRYVAQNTDGYKGTVSLEGGSIAGDQDSNRIPMVQRYNNEPQNIILNFGGKETTIPLHDSTGNPFIRLVFGLTGVERIR